MGENADASLRGGVCSAGDDLVFVQNNSLISRKNTMRRKTDK
jgi:hypothetical protein